MEPRGLRCHLGHARQRGASARVGHLLGLRTGAWGKAAGGARDRVHRAGEYIGEHTVGESTGGWIRGTI